MQYIIKIKFAKCLKKVLVYKYPKCIRVFNTQVVLLYESYFIPMYNKVTFVVLWMVQWL